jgi:hypothetical protein
LANLSLNSNIILLLFLVYLLPYILNTYWYSFYTSKYP